VLPVGTRFLYRFAAPRTDGLTDIQHFHAVITAVEGPCRQWKRIDTLFEENVLRRCETGGFTIEAHLDDLRQGGYEFDESDLHLLKAPAADKPRQDLLPAELEQALPPLYSQEHVEDPIIQVRFFTPDSNWTWYAFEYDPGQRLFFGWVCGMEQEYGYFALSDLETAVGPMGLHIERDVHFRPTSLSTIREARA